MWTSGFPRTGPLISLLVFRPSDDFPPHTSPFYVHFHLASVHFDGWFHPFIHNAHSSASCFSILPCLCPSPEGDSYMSFRAVYSLLFLVRVQGRFAGIRCPRIARGRGRAPEQTLSGP